jgi:uncharacterized protein YbjQ (UPF0145 family)
MIDLYLFLGLLVLGYGVGHFLEKRHFKSIEQREQALLHLVTTSSRYPVGDLPHITHSELVKGSCCISVDYFKRIVAGLRKLFGGNLRSYESLLDRSRREAILRLKESCPGATQIINLRIETSSIFKGHAQQTGTVEVLAYGTAIYT